MISIDKEKIQKALDDFQSEDFISAKETLSGVVKDAVNGFIGDKLGIENLGESINEGRGRSKFAQKADYETTDEAEIAIDDIVGYIMSAGDDAARRSKEKATNVVKIAWFDSVDWTEQDAAAKVGKVLDQYKIRYKVRGKSIMIPDYDDYSFEIVIKRRGDDFYFNPIIK